MNRHSWISGDIVSWNSTRLVLQALHWPGALHYLTSCQQLADVARPGGT